MESIVSLLQQENICVVLFNLDILHSEKIESVYYLLVEKSQKEFFFASVAPRSQSKQGKISLFGSSAPCKIKWKIYEYT
ncbi:unnamed protein product [Hermetia illucens]|uniref:Uncharacterized protein n=1 Tax=Hermetia illucens TaxID=343691 RepID=A0A7R8V2H7_HERIL|nr:unnamed protein product [Hermetia illucens]